MWIFGDIKKDFLRLYAFPLLLLTLFFAIGLPSQIFVVFVVIGLTLDIGHIFMTPLRPMAGGYVNKDLALIYMPLIFGILIFTYFAFKLPYFWTFIYLATFLHQIRQFYGINKWYQKLNGRQDAFSGFFIHALSLLPFLVLTGREDLGDIFYTVPGDILRYHNFTIFSLSLYSYLATLFAWIIYEYTIFRKHGLELNRIASIAIPTLIHGVCFIHGQNIAELGIILLAMHALSYEGLINLSRIRLNKAFLKSPKMRTWVPMAVMLGVGACFLLSEFIPLTNNNGPLDVTKIDNLFRILVISVHSGFLFTHFYLDSTMWKGKHRDAPYIYDTNLS